VALAPMTRGLLGTCTIVAFMATYIALIVGSYFAWRAVLNPASEGPRRKIVRLFRLNALLFPDELSPIGQAYRTRYLKTLTIALCLGSGMLALAILLAFTNPK
jgi:hypothetical protein